jgi:hypothetical protein
LPDYVVIIGTVPANPDCSGDYYYLNEHNGKGCYKHETQDWFLFWDAFNNEWDIAALVEDDTSDRWKQGNVLPPGEYTPQGDYTGYPSIG